MSNSTTAPLVAAVATRLGRSGEKQTSLVARVSEDRPPRSEGPGVSRWLWLGGWQWVVVGWQWGGSVAVGGRVAVWQIGRVAVWQWAAVWQCGSAAVWQCGSAAGWQGGSVADRQSGRLADRQRGRLADRQDGRLAGW
jgi:hypothetical protein